MIRYFSLLILMMFVILNKSFSEFGYGNEFMFAVPLNINQGTNQKQIRMYISSTIRTEVKIFINNTILKRSIFTIPNDVITFDFNSVEAELFAFENGVNVPDDQIYRSKAVHIIAHDPIVVYVVNQNGNSGDGMWIPPVHQLGRQYIVHGSQSFSAPSQLLITSVYDNTVVSVSMPKNKGTVSHDSIGFSYTLNLDRGDVYNGFAKNQNTDFSGAIIHSTRPIAVSVGTQCIKKNNVDYPCEYASTMLMPYSSWGDRYDIQSFRNSLIGEKVSVYSFDDETKIFINGKLDTIFNNPRIGFDIGHKEYNLIDSVYTITSSKPISIIQTNKEQLNNDLPFYFNLTPFNQYQKEYKIIVPTSGFQNHYITLIGENLNKDSIKIYNSLNGLWDKITIAWSLLSIEQINSTTTGYVFKTKSSGYFGIKSNTAFTGYSYGDVSSQAYGMQFPRDIKSDLAQDLENPRILKVSKQCNGNITGSIVDYPRNDSIKRNLLYIDLLQTSENYALKTNEFVPGLSDSITFNLKPIDFNKQGIAYIAVSDVSGNITKDTIRYEPLNSIKFSSKKIDFGNVEVGQSASKKVTIYKALIDSISIVVKSSNVRFKVIDPTEKFNLYNKDSVVIEIEFNSNTAGEFADSIGFKDNCGDFYFASLYAKVLGNPVIEVSDINFGTVEKGQEVTSSFKIVNSSNEPSLLIINDIKLPSNPEFFLIDDIASFLPLKVASGESKEIKIKFKPFYAKIYIDSVVLISNATALDRDALLRGVCVVKSVNELDNKILEKASLNVIDKTMKLLVSVNSNINYNIKLYNEGSELVYNIGEIKLNKGENTFQYKINLLPRGNYFLMIIDSKN
ncbi:MAG: hypothetical protein WAT89_06605, partial [Candidatus Kapaibacterium sp.]